MLCIICSQPAERLQQLGEKVAPVQEFKIKLDTTLLEFPESPEVRLKTVKQIKRVSKNYTMKSLLR